MKRTFLLTAMLLSLALLQACAQYDDKRGVTVNWQDTAMASLVIGTSTRKDVLTLLGPPSQVISMAGQSAFYYLYAHSEGEGLVLIVYNRMRIETQYDRAIFFFDDDEILTEYSTYIHDDTDDEDDANG